MGVKGDKNAARPPEGSLVETWCLIKGPKSAIVPFPGPRSGPKSRKGPGALAILNAIPLISFDITVLGASVLIKFTIISNKDTGESFTIIILTWGGSHCIVTNVLDFNFFVSLNSSHAFLFGLNRWERYDLPYPLRN